MGGGGIQIARLKATAAGLSLPWQPHPG
jgi:hypothetical protein